MDAFSQVDEAVSKPVFGSDGAARWQAFDQKSGSTRSSGHAPLAPLKAADRVGAANWQEERRREDQTRQAQGLDRLDAKQGYTHFTKKTDDDIDDGKLTKKERQRIQSRTRPDDVEYFLPHAQFEGWKWDYVFTTRSNYGTGYYWDGMDSSLELQGKRQRPPTQNITDKKKRERADKEKTNEEKDDKAVSSELKKKKKKKKSDATLQSTTLSNDSSTPHPLDQVAAALAQKNNTDLPLGWQAAKDPFTGKTYYYHTTTQERSWDKPTVTELPAGWTTARDVTSGKVYYYHAATQQTQWERPTE